jgi:hypothetical protein
VDIRARTELVSRYASILENRPHVVGRTRDLPSSKALIRRALLESLLDTKNSAVQSAIEVGLVELDAFVSDEEFALVAAFEENTAAMSREMGSDGARAIIKSEATPNPDAYSEILKRVHTRQEQTLGCIRRLLSGLESE